MINIVTERPGDRAGGYVAMRAGSFSTLNPYGAINVPLVPGIAARVVGEYQSNGSWVDAVKGKRWSIQPSLSIRIDADTDLLLQGQFNHRSTLEYSGMPADAALAGILDRKAFPGSPVGQPRTKNDNSMGTATLHHAFSDRVKLTDRKSVV